MNTRFLLTSLVAVAAISAIAGCGSTSGAGLTPTSAPATAVVVADPTATPVMTPDPTPVPTPDPTPVPTPDTSTAYFTLMYADSRAVANALGAESAYITANPTDFAGIVTVVNTSKQTAERMLADMDTVTPPPSMVAADRTLRHALSLLISGCDLQSQGITNINPTQITDGTAMVGQATALLATATSQLP